MLILVIALAAAVCILLFLLFLRKRELKSVSAQLRKIACEDTNSLISSVSGTADELINEINLLLKELRENRAEYKRKSHDLEQMMTNISHDLRTPLTSAMGYINMIQSSGISEEEKLRELGIVGQRLNRLEELINSFFELSKIISSGKPPEHSELNLVSVIEEAVVHYYDDYSGQDRRIILDTPQHRLMISSNSYMLLRIFDNLISNAFKHGVGDLSVSVRSGERLSIAFANDLSSPDIDIEHIFDEFYTTDISRTKGNTGLGLAIAKQFTELLGGRIDAHLDGMRFVITVTL